MAQGLTRTKPKYERPKSLLGSVSGGSVDGGSVGGARQRIHQRFGQSCLRIRLLENRAVPKGSVDASGTITRGEHERHAAPRQYLGDRKTLFTRNVYVEHRRVDF